MEGRRMDYALGLKEDAGKVLDRFEGFFQGEIVDRPLVSMTVVRDGAPEAEAEPAYPSLEERWLDVDNRAERLDRDIGRYAFIGDALPICWPNMGPEIFSACCGCGYEYGQDTTWSIPAIEDWARDGDKVHFNPEHPLWKATMRFAERLIELSRGRYIVGLTDFHPGGDHLTALRDPANLAMDLFDNPDRVKALVTQSYPEYFSAYDQMRDLVANAGHPATSWLPAASFHKFYIPSCDFSALISSEQFEEFFMPGIHEECRFYDRSIYHMDGPGEIRHLDLILDIPKLHAIQWVCGAGHEELCQWIPLLKKMRAGGKSIMVYCTSKELDLVFANFKPEGVWIYPTDVADEETALAVLKRVECWK